LLVPHLLAVTGSGVARGQEGQLLCNCFYWLCNLSLKLAHGRLNLSFLIIIIKGWTARAAIGMGRQKWGVNGKNGGEKGQQASRDFWGWQNCSLPRATITHTTPLLPGSYVL